MVCGDPADDLWVFRRPASISRLPLFTYAAEPGSGSEEALKLLGSWAATIASPESARSTGL
jgi:hypothetical protein